MGAGSPLCPHLEQCHIGVTENAGLENAGLENAGPNLQQDEIYYFQFGSFSGTLKMAAQTVNNYKILI